MLEELEEIVVTTGSEEQNSFERTALQQRSQCRTTHKRKDC